MVLGYFICISYNKVTGTLSVCMYVSKDLITAEPIWLSFTVKLPIGPEVVLGHFIFIPYNKVTGSLSVCMSVSLSVCTDGLGTVRGHK